MDCPTKEDYKCKCIKKKIKLDNKTFNKKKLNCLIDSDEFKINFNKFVELQIIIFENEIEIEPIEFLEGIIEYRPTKYKTTHSYIFVCCRREEGVVTFKELYGKRSRKIIGHIMLEERFEELIHHLEERVLFNM
jgi:hypothetical protein